ncbi:phosphoribosylanthranilate isomerase [Phenylobacterium sp. SCN 70-31]|uniref:phosphoribosylanthranilate isomerase n=1 Tax=Phenylobacterium sp. SCN 70-31 TaxID=1660129 RepID=UPI0008691EFA|nr:phosphoribosylanthranilate isomerase [Phenylobacterium sp. SCN 70-31]ODT85494.1 MAG: N-(5'-phosphoribosyl)anthranilate isomerase [Phenylobacterium sp. SCN 70-31]
MSAKAKICGVSTPEAVRAVVDGGAAYLGFMFFPRSPRNIAAEAAARLAPPARARGVKIVAVVVDPSDDDLDALVAGLSPDLIQLHGRETPARAREIAARSGRGIVKVVPVSEAADIDAARAYEPVVEHLMFETKPPKDADRPGGLGVAFDWTLLQGRRFQRPWFLAGGLNPWNVGEALAASGAPLADVSSGVERGPGLKDPALITAFLDAVRRA